MSWVFPDSTSLPMMTIPAVFDMLFFYRNKTMASKLSAREAVYISNSLQLIKKWQRGLEQTKRHL